jgi:hypothetical protein
MKQVILCHVTDYRSGCLENRLGMKQSLHLRCPWHLVTLARSTTGLPVNNSVSITDPFSNTL